MKKKKYFLSAGVGLVMAVSLTGCAGGQGGENETQASLETVTFGENAESTENVKNDAQGKNDESNGAEMSSEYETQTETDTSAVQDIENEPTDDSSITNETGKHLNISQDAEIIGGKVRSVSFDNIVISRTLIDEECMVTMPEAGSADEQLVTVCCTASTVFELWTIQGGGAGIDTKGASFSDIGEGSGIEAEGHFEGEEFIADKVIIEIYK